MNQNKITQDYILLILNCEKYRHKAARQRETWIPTLSDKIQYFHVLGDPKLNEEYIIDHENHILYVKVPDNYNSLPKKVIAAYKAISQVYKFKYIFKTDDDQNVITIQFFEVLIHLLNKSFGKENQIHYGGKIVDVRYTHVSQYYKIHPELPQNLIIKQCKYCNGRFYFLSSSAVDGLIERENQINEEYFEDYAIGINLQDNFKTNMLRLDTDKVFVDFS
jgi:hypothetical protein